MPTFATKTQGHKGFTKVKVLIFCFLLNLCVLESLWHFVFLSFQSAVKIIFWVLKI